MKLRIKDNSLRLRLLQSEVAALAETGRVEAHTLLSATNEKERICYAIEHADHYKSISVVQLGYEIRVTAPSHEILDWANGEAVGVYGEQQVYGRQTLTITIEKDFACLDGSDTDNSDTFSNPIMRQC